MSSLAISVIVFASVFGGALLGMLLRASLPKEHLSPESRDVVKLAMGIIATMTAVVLGLLVASDKGYYDTQSRELTEMSAQIVLLDRVLAHFGPEAKDTAIRYAVRLYACSTSFGRKTLRRAPTWNPRGQLKLSLTKFRSLRRRTTPSAPFSPVPWIWQ